MAAVMAVLALAVYLFFFYDSSEAPAPTPVIGEQVEESGSVVDELAPEFDLVRISRGGTGVIAGRMAPGAQVELYANGKKVSEVIANEDGEWVIILDEPLEAGSVELNLKATNGDSTTQTEADQVVVVSVPERDTERFVEQAQNGVVAVLTPKDGKGASTVLQKPGVAAFAEVGDSLSVDTVDFGAGNGVVFAGRSLPRVNVRLYLDGEFVNSVRASDSGSWTISQPDGILSPGTHTVRVDQTVADGTVQLRVEQPFVAGEPIDQSLAENGVFIRPGNTLWQIARQLYGSGVRYTLIFGENSEQITDPDLIYPGQIFKLPTKSVEQ
ncbi:LysM peptidoglycan-binding domain-containing protein [Kordiimonas aquimaris]|uniref:LysM peptidoglycan-binding domain-containing protein n=1 Tax=Kordiimonas aquimaris TaxID=707591 RepID=UPI0021D00037|nr:LysM peptidoglycan-binding domain-containing protein [Kordiimonas aquimaris]